MAITKSVARRFASQKAYSWERMDPGVKLSGPEGNCFIQGEQAYHIIDKLENAEHDWEVQQLIEQYCHLMS